MSDLNAIIDLHQVTNPLPFQGWRTEAAKNILSSLNQVHVGWSGGPSKGEDKLIIKEVVSSVSFKVKAKLPPPSIELISLENDDIGGLVFIFFFSPVPCIIFLGGNLKFIESESFSSSAQRIRESETKGVGT